jgi:hypothetical protein
VPAIEPRKPLSAGFAATEHQELLDAKGAKNAKMKKRVIFKRGAGVPPTPCAYELIRNR